MKTEEAIEQLVNTVECLKAWEPKGEPSVRPALEHAIQVMRESLWRPIDTAPIDGTVILVYGEEAGEINGPSGEMSIGFAYYTNGSTDYKGYDWNACGGDAYASWFKPVFWKMQPTPPEDK